MTFFRIDGAIVREPEPMEELERLAASARPMNDDDCGSDRQVNAENLFFDRVAGLLDGPEGTAWDDLCNYCSKATPEERIDEAMRVLREAVRS